MKILTKDYQINLLQPDYKIFEMNKRLQQRTDDSDNLWLENLFNFFIFLSFHLFMNIRTFFFPHSHTFI